jgi:hypothetical protein
MRRGRAPTASRAKGGVARPCKLEDDLEMVSIDLGVVVAVIASGWRRGAVGGRW